MKKPTWFKDKHWQALDLARIEGLPVSMATTYLKLYKLNDAKCREALEYYCNAATKSLGSRIMRNWLATRLDELAEYIRLLRSRLMRR